MRCFMCCTCTPAVTEPQEPRPPQKPVYLKRLDTAFEEGDETGQRSRSMPASSTDPALPPDIIKAFLQSHNTQDDGVQQSQPLDSVASVDSVDAEDATQPHLPNPFAVAADSNKTQQLQHQQPTTAPDKAASCPKTPQQHQQQQQQAVKLKQPKQRSLLRRIVRGLVLTGVSTGLVAAGAWAGTVAYRHYMTQLDDRDQLARRVEELRKQEGKLVTRCTALEQERDRLKEKVSELSATVADASDTKTQLKQQLKTSTADRDEAVRHNLKLQSKLSSLEEDYAGLQQVNQEAVRQLEESKAQVDRLTKEAGQLTALVEKLEGRCSKLDSLNTKLKGEVAETAQQHKQQAAV